MKKILGSLMTALLIVFMFSITVSAAQLSKEDIVSLVNSTNVSIEQKIAKAQTQANTLMIVNYTIVSSLEKAQQILQNNNQAYAINLKLIEQSNLRCENQLDIIVNDLVETTNSIADETISIANENGIEIICELVEVQIGDREVLIDPLRVVGD